MKGVFWGIKVRLAIAACTFVTYTCTLAQLRRTYPRNIILAKD